MWFLCSKCKIFLDIKLGDPTNPMGLNRNQATFKQASATEAAGAFRFVFLSESRRFGKASRTSRDHLTTIAGDLRKTRRLGLPRIAGRQVCHKLQMAQLHFVGGNAKSY
jgi:hypothetical protein